MSDNDVARKLEKLGLIMNHPEPTLICSRCKYALRPSGVRVSGHLAERHNVPASDRTELVTLPNQHVCLFVCLFDSIRLFTVIV